MKNCSICSQKTEIFTTIHKNYPFVDGRNYPIVCFTCFFTPKILKQTYNEDGSIKENEEIVYSCKNLNSAKELLSSGSCDSLNYAKKCIFSIKSLCEKQKKITKNISRPTKVQWNLN